MNEQDKARPVSGEIMAAAAARREPARKAEFSDAEYETVEVARETATPARFPASGVDTGMDFLKGEGASATAHGGSLFWVAGLVLVLLGFWVAGGHAVVRHAVSLAPAQTREALRIGEIESRVEARDGRGVLFVEGRAENHGPERRALPPIEIAVTANDGSTVRYFLGTNGAELASGDRYSFSSRLEAPTKGVKSVSVAFREDAR